MVEIANGGNCKWRKLAAMANGGGVKSVPLEGCSRGWRRGWLGGSGCGGCGGCGAGGAGGARPGLGGADPHQAVGG